MFWNRHKKLRYRYLAIAVLFFIVFTSYRCNRTNPITEWELQQNNRVVEILETEPFTPFCNSDSALLVNAEHEWLKQQKMSQLQLQIDSAKTDYEHALAESESISNPTLKKHFLNQVLGMKKKIELQESILALYSDSTAYTQLAILKQREAYYMLHPQEIIGFSQVVNMVIQTGSLPATKVTKRYLYSVSKKQIVAEFPD